MTHVLLAPDKFKGSLSAAEVAHHVARGLRRVDTSIGIDEIPVADGGEGTVAAALAAGYDHVDVEATGPLGETRSSGYALLEATAVIEMAAVSGIEMIEPSATTAGRATSRGVGELIVHALDGGASTIVIGVGGSASTDGGAGMLRALGAELRAGESTVPEGGAGLGQLSSVDLSGLHPRLAEAQIVLASDVDNPLLGPTGAAAVYGPQKGLDETGVRAIEAGLQHWVTALAAAGITRAHSHAAEPGAGAAGGVGYACLLLGAQRRAGIDVVLEFTGFHDRLPPANLVITGEGSLDSQSLSGKTPVGVAKAAASQGVRTLAVCGRNLLLPGEAAAAGIAEVYSLTDLSGDEQRAMTEAGPLLEDLGPRIVAEHISGQEHPESRQGA